MTYRLYRQNQSHYRMFALRPPRLLSGELPTLKDEERS
jgi:hypothetical protein